MNKVKNKIILSVSVFMLLTLAFFYVGQTYLIKDVEDLSAEIVAKKKELNSFSTRNDRLVSLRGSYEEIAIGAEEVSGTVVDEDKVVEVIEKIEELSDSNNVKLRIQSVSANDKNIEEETYISKKNFDLVVGGEFDDIMYFLGSLENFDYYVSVDNLKIGFGNFDDYNKNLTILNCRVVVYQKQNEEN